MKRVFSDVFVVSLVALLAGLGLRLLFILKFPATSGDTVLYEQMATNWLQHHVYAMNVDGAITPVDMRMPGYPAFLVLIYLLTGKIGAAAHLSVMLAQALVDLASCLVIAALGVLLVVIVDGRARVKAVFFAGLWLAVSCPFIANYSATLLTETLAVFLTAVALIFVVALATGSGHVVFPPAWRLSHRPWHHRVPAMCMGLAVGAGTLFRPETPLLLMAAWMGTALVLWPHGKFRQWLRIAAFSGMACVLPLLPWAVRNAITLHEVQFLAPRNSNLPSELVPRGFMAWEKTWLFRVRDAYQVSWKLNGEAIEIDAIPARAFDSAEEKVRVGEILERYNDDLTITPEEDAAFGELARERTTRHPLRTYLLLPAARAVTLWFTPRIELLPFSGTVFPLKQSWYDDRTDQRVTVGFFFLNIFYGLSGIWGAWRLWRWNRAVRPALLTLAIFVLLRTAFLTTLETPEPRYVLECYPVLLALGATLFARSHGEAAASAGA
ncbi:MAG: hypothetical protein ABSG16_01750 [Candidatus Acidiferrum sp.]|jgi:hypothetical protein